MTDVSDLTGFPEMMDGRVKTLHPRSTAACWRVRDEPEHVAAHGEARHRADRPGRRQPLPVRGDGGAAAAPFEDAIENIDIGGPAMLRSAAKNHGYVAVVTDPADYAPVLAELDAQRRRHLAWRCARGSPPRPSPRTARLRRRRSASWFACADERQTFPAPR